MQQPGASPLDAVYANDRAPTGRNCHPRREPRRCRGRSRAVGPSGKKSPLAIGYRGRCPRLFHVGPLAQLTVSQSTTRQPVGFDAAAPGLQAPGKGDSPTLRSVALGQSPAFRRPANPAERRLDDPRRASGLSSTPTPRRPARSRRRTAAARRAAPPQAKGLDRHPAVVARLFQRSKVVVQSTCPVPGVPRSFSEIWTWIVSAWQLRIARRRSCSSMLA